MIRNIRSNLALLDSDSRRKFVFAIPASVALSVLEMLALYLIYPFVQALANPESIQDNAVFVRIGEVLGAQTTSEFVARVGMCVFGLFVVRSILSVLYYRWQYRVLAFAEARLTERIFDRYMHLPWSAYTVRHTSELIRTAYSSTEEFIGFIVTSYVYIVSETVLVIAVFIVLFVVQPAAMLGVVLVLSVSALVYVRFVGRWSRRLGARHQESALQIHQYLQEALGAYKAIATADVGDAFSEEFTEVRDNTARIRAKIWFSNQLPRYYLETALIVTILVTALILIRLNPGAEALGALGLFVAGAFRVLPSLVRILTSSNNIRIGQASAETLRREIALIGETPPSDETIVPLPLHERLSFEHVTFSYRTETDVPPALADVSFELRSGEMIGVVGKSGAGKTTLADLVLGLYLPDSGTVLIDSLPLERGNLRSWRRSVGYVPQDVLLLDDTLAQNIALNHRGAPIDPARLQRVLDQAQLTPLLDQLEQGAATKIGQRGVRLSGGQRQRIGIARALFSDPSLIVLDEATSALDAATESEITQTLESLRGSCTFLIIAHRLSTLSSCDRILLLDGGRLVDQGTFAELIERNADFARVAELSGIDAR